MESGPPGPPASRCWFLPLYPVRLAGLSVAVAVFQRRHLGLGSRWQPLLTDHQLLHSPHEGCGVGPGLRNPFPASGHGAGTTNCGSLQQHSPLTCLMMSWESPFISSCRTPRDRAVFSPKIGASYSAMLVALNSKCTMYLYCSPTGVRSRAPLPAPYLREEPLT
jgi:hypothetical protein